MAIPQLSFGEVCNKLFFSIMRKESKVVLINITQAITKNSILRIGNRLRKAANIIKKMLPMKILLLFDDMISDLLSGKIINNILPHKKFICYYWLDQVCEGGQGML